MAGQYFFKVDDNFLPLSGGTVSGNTYVSANLSADTLNLVNLPNNDDSLTQILARNSANGDIEYRDVQSIISAATSQDTYITGGTYNNVSNELSLERNDAVNIIISGFSSGAQFGTTYFVAPEGNDLTGEYGNISKPFKTITGARNQLLVDSLSGQTLIYVFPGTYNETELQYPNGKIYLSPGSLIKPSAKINGVGAGMIAVNQGTKTFTFNGNWASYLTIGKRFKVVGGSNDGTYTIVLPTDVGATTEVVVLETIPSASAGGFLRTNESIFILGDTPINAPSGSTSNKFELYGEGDIDIVQSLDSDWSSGIITSFGSSEFYGEAVSWRMEKGVMIGAFEDSKMTFNGSNLELYGGGGYVTTVRDSTDTTFNFDRILCNGSFGFFVRYGSNPTFNGSCVVTANLIKGTNNCQTLAIQRMSAGGRVVINSPIIETESWTLNSTQHSGGEAIINGNIFATTVNGKGIVAGLDSTGAKFTINGNITTDANTAFLGVGGVNSDWYFNGNIESLSGSSANPLLNFGSGSGSVTLNGSVKNTDGGSALDGIQTSGVNIIVENLEVISDNETITSSSPQTVEILNSLSINKPLGSNITTTGLYNFTGTTNVGDLVIYNTPTNDDSLTQILGRNSTTGDIEYRDVQSIISAATSQDTFVTGFTYDGSNKFTISDNSGSTFSTIINTVTGLTSNGDLEVVGNVVVTGGTGNVLAKQIYVEGNLGLDWDFPSNSVVLGNNVDETIINGNSLTVNSDTLVNGSITGSSLNLSSISNDDSLNEILARNSSGLIEYRDVYSIIGAASADTYVVSGNADVATSQLNFTYNTGGTFTVTNSAALFSDNDINVTGGTYNPTTGCVTFSTNSGTTFDVCGFVTGITDTYVTGGTYNSSTDTIDLTRTDLGAVSITGVTDTFYWTTGSTGNYSIRALNNTAVDATGDYAVAEGAATASGNYSHAEGSSTASGQLSHAEGSSVASGRWSHSEGYYTTASADYSHAEGYFTIASGNTSHAEGYSTVAGLFSHAEGYETKALSYSHAEGLQTTASGDASHATGYASVASGLASWAGGQLSTASGDNSFIHSTLSLVTGDRSVVLGGQSLTGATDDTVYVPFLNINNLASGTSINNLGIDSSGNVVTGSADENDITRVQPGTNINTGGTANNPIVNLEDDILLSSVSATTLSGGTLYSGSTDLSDIFLTTADGNDITRVQNGINTFTGGTENNPTINVTALTIDNITVSGDSSFDSVSATTIYSGSTDLSDIFATKGEDSFSTGGTVTQKATSASTEVVIQIDGNNDFSSYNVTGLTDTFVSGFTYSANTFTINQNDGNSIDAEIDTIDLSSVLSAVTFDIGTTGSISATTFYSGSTDLSEIFLTEADGNDITRVQPGTNINTGGTANNPIVNLDDDILLNSVSGNTLSGGTIYSGSTDLYDIFLTTADGNDITRVQGGTNISTGGTANNPIVNLDDDILLNSVSGNTLSGGTIYSGSTDLYDIFLTENDGNDITRVQGGTNISTGGTANNPIVNLDDDILLNSVSGNTLSGGTIYSGSTDLYDIFLTENDGNDITRVQGGINTFTGGTGNNPTVNVTGLTVDNISVSGVSSFQSVSATTIYSGSTDLYDIFLTENDGNDITRVQGGTNISTGGTANNPIVNLDDDILLNSVSGNTLSGGTIYSGSTDLYDIFLTENVIWTTGSTGNFSLKTINDSGLDATGNYALAEGRGTIASGISSHAEGRETVAGGSRSHAEGWGTTALGEEAHAEGYETTASGETTHSEGLFTVAIGDYSHAEGWSTTASGEDSHSEGFGTLASGADSHAEGLGNTASNTASHAEGFNTISTSIASHSEGFDTLASADAAHSEGYSSTASGLASHSEGFGTTSSGSFSHAGGSSSIASGDTSFIHSTNSLVTGSRSVVLGGQNITGTTDDTVYVPYLNINSLATGTSVNNLGIDIDGNVVTGSTDENDITRVQGGTNISTGGTANNPIVNLDDDISLNSVSGNTLSGGTIYSGSTDLYDIFLTTADGNDITRVQGGTNISTGGTANNPTVNLDDDISLSSVSATTLSGGTLYSGSTDLTTIIESLDTFITGFTYNDNNTFTIFDNDGDSFSATINQVSGLTVDGILSATTYTGLTLNSLDDVITNIPTTPDATYQGELLYFDTVSNQWVSGDEYGNLGEVTIWGKKGSAGTIDKGCPVYIVGFDSDIHEVELANATTGSTMPVIGFTAEDFDNAGIYPIVTFGKLTGIDTTSGSTILNPFGETWEVNDVLYVAKSDGGLTKFRPSGTNTQIQRIAKVLKVDATGGQLFIFNTARTAGLPNLTTDYLWVGNGNDTPQELIKTDVGITTTGFTYNNNNTLTITDDNGGSLSSTINQMSGLTINGDLIVRDNTSLSGLTTVYGDTPTSAAIAPGIDNTYDLGQPSFRWREIYTTNLDATNAITSNSLYAGFSIESPSISGTSISASTIYSGSTDLYDIFLTTNDGNDITRVQPGTNINTGGTANNPIVNLDDDILLNSVSGNTLSGGTIYSGSTDLYNIFATSGSSGESNTASNLGSGEGVFAQKIGVDLQFKSLTSTGTSLSISSDSTTVNLERNNLVSVTSITSSSYSAITSDEIIGLDTTSISPTLFLPDSTTAGKVRFEIKDIGVNARTNPITIQTVGSDTIITTSIVSSTQIFVDGGSIILVSTGSGQWWQM